MLVKNNVLSIKITDMLEEVKEVMCDKYCKYPEQYKPTETGLDELYEKYCNVCPMNAL